MALLSVGEDEPTVEPETVAASVASDHKEPSDSSEAADGNRPSGERKSLAQKRHLFQSRHGQQAGTGVLSLFDFRNFLQWRTSKTGGTARYTVGELESKIYDNVHHEQEGELLLPLKILSRDAAENGPTPRILRFTDWKANLAAQACLFVALVSSIISPLTFMWGGSWADPDWVPGGRGLMIVDLLCDLGYLSFLLLELNMSFLHPSRKVEVTEPSKIRRHRMTNVIYLVKLFSVTSYLWIIPFNASLLLNLAKIVRLHHFVRLPDPMWLVWDNGLIRTARPVFLLIWLAHWVGCLLAWGGGYREALLNAGSADAFETTLNGHVIRGEFSLYFMAYVEALYMLTGALDNPLGDGGYREKNFGSLIMLFGPVGCIIVAQIIATVVREQERKNALDIRHEENQAFVKRALENLNVPIELQRRVFSLHYFQKMSHDYEAFEHLFKNHTLSSPLEDAIRVYLYQSVLTSSFFSNKEHSYILAVVRVLEDKAFLPGDYVVRVGEVADEMYFISKGEVSVLVSKGKSKEVEDAFQLPLRKREGDHFGEVALIKGSLRTAWVKAETYVVASCLKRSSIEQIWKYFPHERETLQREVMKTVMRDAARTATARRSVIGAALPEQPVPTGLGAAPKEAHSAQSDTGEALSESAVQSLARIERICESMTTRQQEMLSRLEDLEKRLPGEGAKIKGAPKDMDGRAQAGTTTTKKSLKPATKKKSARPEPEEDSPPGGATASEIGRPLIERTEA